MPAILRKPKKGTPDFTDDVPAEAFADDVKRKLALKSVMPQKTTEADVIQSELVQDATLDDKDAPEHEQPLEDAPEREYGPETAEDGVGAIDDQLLRDGMQYDKEAVNYRYASDPQMRCQLCTHFIAPGRCEIVAGLIRAYDVCDKFDPLNNPQTQQPGDIVQSWLMVDPIEEVAPPGWEGTVKRMKDHPEITNPWALAWYMKNRGYSSHKGPRGGKKKEDQFVTAEIVETFDPGQARDDTGQWTDQGGGSRSRHADVVKRAGAKFNGIQDTPWGEKYVMFTDNVTGSTGMLPIEDATFDNIQRHVLDIRKKFKQYARTSEDESIWEPEKHPRDDDGKFGDKGGVDDERITDRFAKSEKPAERKRRIKKMQIDPERATVIRKALGRECILIIPSTLMEIA